jgi:hypothetical protein
MSVYDLGYAYKVIDSSLVLLEVNSLGNYGAPSQDLTDGIKFEYYTGGQVFVDANGDSDDLAPTETSILNCKESEVPCVLAYIRAAQEPNPQIRTYLMDEFTRLLTKTKNAQRPEIKQFRPIYPYNF